MIYTLWTLPARPNAALAADRIRSSYSNEKKAGETDGESNSNKAKEETKEEAEENGSSPNEPLLKGRGYLRGIKCMNSTNGPKMNE